MCFRFLCGVWWKLLTTPRKQNNLEDYCNANLKLNDSNDLQTKNCNMTSFEHSPGFTGTSHISFLSIHFQLVPSSQIIHIVFHSTSRLIDKNSDNMSFAINRIELKLNCDWANVEMPMRFVSQKSCPGVIYLNWTLHRHE